MREKALDWLYFDFKKRLLLMPMGSSRIWEFYKDNLNVGWC
jgi:hypothetical protein